MLSYQFYCLLHIKYCQHRNIETQHRESMATSIIEMAPAAKSLLFTIISTLALLPVFISASSTFLKIWRHVPVTSFEGMRLCYLSCLIYTLVGNFSPEKECGRATELCFLSLIQIWPQSQSMNAAGSSFSIFSKIFLVYEIFSPAAVHEHCPLYNGPPS